MADVQGMLSDPTFNALDPATQRQALTRLDPTFGGLSDDDYQSFRKRLTPLPGTEKTGLPGIPQAPLPEGLKQNPSILSQVHSDILSGPGSRQMAHAIPAIANGDWKGGAADLMEGAGGALAPLAIPSAVAAPVAAATGAVGSYLGGKVGGAIASHFNASPEAQRLSEDVGNAAGGALGALGGSAASGAIKNAARVDPAKALIKAYRPTASDSGFTERIPNAVNDIAAHGERPINGNEDVIPAAQKTIQKFQDTLEQWLEQSRQMNAQVSTDPIVHATQRAMPSTMRLESPNQAQHLLEQTQAAYGNKTMGVDDLRTLLKEKNAELDSFYDKSAGKQQASVVSGAPQAVVKAQRDAIADALYHALDPENGGAGPREIQKRTGDVIELLDNAMRRRNAIIGEKPVSQMGSLGKFASSIANIPGKIMHGDVGGAIDSAMHPIQGPSDAMIGSAFGSPRPSAPLPLPPGPTGPRPVTPKPEIQRRLDAGAINVQPSVDASYVRSVPATPAPTNGMRALPPASTILQGAGPDTSYVHGIPAEYPPVEFPPGKTPAVAVKMPPQRQAAYVRAPDRRAALKNTAPRYDPLGILDQDE